MDGIVLAYFTIYSNEYMFVNGLNLFNPEFMWSQGTDYHYSMRYTLS